MTTNSMTGLTTSFPREIQRMETGQRPSAINVTPINVNNDVVRVDKFSYKENSGPNEVSVPTL